MSDQILQFNYYHGQDKIIETKKGPTKVYQRKTTVVLLVDKKTAEYSRGVAICNDSDNFCKKTGRDIALSRARKALGQKKNCHANIMRNSVADNSLLPDWFDNKCSYGPELTDHESRIYKSVVKTVVKTVAEYSPA